METHTSNGVEEMMEPYIWAKTRELVVELRGTIYMDTTKMDCANLE